MPTLPISMRTHVGVMVALMGLLGLGLALLTGEYYRHLIFENQRTALARIGAVKASALMNDLEARARDLGLALQQSPEFRVAFAARDRARLESLLEQQLHRYFVTAGVLRLDGLHVLDPELRTVASLDTDTMHGTSLCPEILQRIAVRPITERIKPIGMLCTEAAHAHHTMLVAIGGLRLSGYVAVVTDPSPLLQTMEESLGIPLRLRVGNHVLAVGPHWDEAALGEPLLAQSHLPADGLAPLTVEFASTTGELDAELRRARLFVMLLAGATTFTLILLALGLFNRCTLQPLRRLTERMRLVRGDRAYLGTQIEPEGNIEMRQLADDFNEFSAELKELHQTLEALAYNDALTGLPNRLLFRDRLEQQIRLAERDNACFAVLAIDLDRFKEINDTLGHHAGDLLLQQVSQRMRRTLRRSDTLSFSGHTVARLGGDEFCALLPAVKDASEAVIVAEKLLAAMEEEFDLDGKRIRAGMSVGIALYPEHAIDADAISRCADGAMYQAKRAGGGYALCNGTPRAVAASG